MLKSDSLLAKLKPIRWCAVSALHAAVMASAAGQTTAPSLHIENSSIATSPADWHFAQSRAAVLPGDRPTVIVTSQQIVESAGVHNYRDLLWLQTNDDGMSWTAPATIRSLQRKPTPRATEVVIGDACPQWNSATKKLLITGKTFGFHDGREDPSQERVAYATFDPGSNTWSDLKLLALPEKDHAGREILEPNSGCCQRVDSADGQILLPIRYRADRQSPAYTTMVARCKFDGATLSYQEHGSELSIAQDRGLYEPSLVHFQNDYFLTLRADASGYASRSDDGLHFAPTREWTFDDGSPLGSYNAQQHWMLHAQKLYLAYARRGAGNDDVFRNRAPLFIAEVDSQSLCVIRGSEQILMPNGGLDLAGGFGIVDVTQDETWVTTSELNYPKARQGEPNHILLAKIRWDQPATNLPVNSGTTP